MSHLIDLSVALSMLMTIVFCFSARMYKRPDPTINLRFRHTVTRVLVPVFIIAPQAVRASAQCHIGNA